MYKLPLKCSWVKHRYSSKVQVHQNCAWTTLSLGLRRGFCQIKGIFFLATFGRWLCSGVYKLKSVVSSCIDWKVSWDHTWRCINTTDLSKCTNLLCTAENQWTPFLFDPRSLFCPSWKDIAIFKESAHLNIYLWVERNVSGCVLCIWVCRINWLTHLHTYTHTHNQ